MGVGQSETVVFTSPPSRAYTVEDLDAFPDDGRRRELLDGMLVVTPAPHGRHQRAVTRLLVALDAALPARLEVLPAPYDWRISEHTVLEPDLLVVRRADIGARHEAIPGLVVEVLSPSTRRFDLLTKRDAYDAAGVPAYWVVDPDEPSLTVLQRQGDRLVVVGSVAGDDTVTVDHPAALTLRPADLVR